MCFTILIIRSIQPIQVQAIFCSTSVFTVFKSGFVQRLTIYTGLSGDAAFDLY